MENYNFVFTFKVSGEQKEILSELLAGKGKVVFLKDISPENRSSVLSNANILIAWNPLRELKNIDKENLKGIRFVQLLSAGFDHIDINQFSPDCIIASNNGAYSEPMAEHIVGMILSLYKNFLTKHNMMAGGEFDQLSENRMLKNAVCGIIGFGGIGKAAAKLLRPFGVKIYAVNTSGKTEEETDFTGTLNELDYVLSNSDIIVLSIPLKERTKNLIGKRELELMKPDGIIINVARGSIINERDLYFHLKNNGSFKAGIDAWWSEPFAKGSFELNYPFFGLPNLLGSPHNSAVVPGALFYGAERAVSNVLNFIDRKKVFGIIEK